jgi:hypothetical protein
MVYVVASPYHLAADATRRTSQQDWWRLVIDHNPVRYREVSATPTACRHRATRRHGVAARHACNVHPRIDAGAPRPITRRPLGLKLDVT